MRTAVVRVVVDRAGTLSAGEYEEGLRRLRERGTDVVASPAERLPDRNREIELIVAGLDLADLPKHVTLCAESFRTPAEAGVVTYISRGPTTTPTAYSPRSRWPGGWCGRCAATRRSSR
ncbi:hypothetical protein [Phytohabitans suffuscus]|nr:hypothetical protein [Phytohabitans suffuscus]